MRGQDGVIRKGVRRGGEPSSNNQSTSKYDRTVLSRAPSRAADTEHYLMRVFRRRRIEGAWLERVSGGRLHGLSRPFTFVSVIRLMDGRSETMLL